MEAMFFTQEVVNENTSFVPSESIWIEARLRPKLFALFEHPTSVDVKGEVRLKNSEEITPLAFGKKADSGYPIQHETLDQQWKQGTLVVVFYQDVEVVPKV